MFSRGLCGGSLWYPIGYFVVGQRWVFMFFPFVANHGRESQHMIMADEL